MVTEKSTNMIRKLRLDITDCPESKGGSNELRRATAALNQTLQPWELYRGDQWQVDHFGGWEWSKIEKSDLRNKT